MPFNLCSLLFFVNPEKESSSNTLDLTEQYLSTLNSILAQCTTHNAIQNSFSVSQARAGSL